MSLASTSKDIFKANFLSLMNVQIFHVFDYRQLFQLPILARGGAVDAEVAVDEHRVGEDYEELDLDL